LDEFDPPRSRHGSGEAGAGLRAVKAPSGLEPLYREQAGDKPESREPSASDDPGLPDDLRRVVERIVRRAGERP
jgi:hypothetical protein